MSNIYMHVHGIAGCTIEQATSELVALADRVRVACVLDFNGVELMGFPDADPDELVAMYRRQLAYNRERAAGAGSSRPTCTAERTTRRDDVTGAAEAAPGSLLGERAPSR